MRGYEATTSAPPISEGTAIFCGLLFTTFYVAPFYLSPTLRTSPLNSRDNPTVIKARVRAVLWSCVASTIVTILVLATYGHATPSDVLRLFGFWPFAPFDCLKILALQSVLYAGPLYEVLVVDRGWKDLSIENIKRAFWKSPIGHRNLVIAPWCEELVFRSLVISLYLLAGVSPSRIVFTSPLIFGVAHVHHFAEMVSTQTPTGTFPTFKTLALSAAVSLMQLSYTTLFGFFVAFVFLRTGSVFASIVAHTFCNYMGLPRVHGRLGTVDFKPDVVQDMVPTPTKWGEIEYSHGIAWTVVYYVLLFVGAGCFTVLLWPLTESSNALAHF